MKKPGLGDVLKSVSLHELESLVSEREKVDGLEKRRNELREELFAVNRQIDSILRSVEDLETGGHSAKKKGSGKKRGPGTAVKPGRSAPGKAAARHSVSSLVAEILEEKNKPLTVYEICGALLNEKNYRTDSPNFDSQILALLQENPEGLFSELRPGKFILLRK